MCFVLWFHVDDGPAPCLRSDRLVHESGYLNSEVVRHYRLYKLGGCYKQLFNG